jgi:hypothetical protein
LPVTAAGADGKKQVTGSDKRLFAKALYQISQEDLGKVLVEVESKCPAAIVRSSGEDELELNIDKIQSSLLQELTAFVNTVKNTKKKKSTSGSSNNKRQKA